MNDHWLSVRILEYQNRLLALADDLGYKPARPVWIAGGPRRGWTLNGRWALPGTQKCPTWHDALIAAENWVKQHKDRG